MQQDKGIKATAVLQNALGVLLAATVVVGIAAAVSAANSKGEDMSIPASEIANLPDAPPMDSGLPEQVETATFAVG